MRSFTSERRAESSVPLLQKFVQTDAEAGFIARADVMTPDLPSYPIVVGVTGHRDIASEAQDAVCAAVHAVLEGLRAAFGAALHIMTALADGTDQLVADAAEVLGLKITAVSPMPLATYRATVANKDRLDHHWKRAALRANQSSFAGAADILLRDAKGFE